MTLQDELNHYLAANHTEAAASLASMAARFSRDAILQEGSVRRHLLTPVPLVLDAEDSGWLSAVARAMCDLQSDVPRLLGGLDSVLDDNREPAAVRPFIKAQIPYSVHISRCDFLRAPDGWYLTEINTGPGLSGITVGEYNDCISENEFLTKFFDAHSCAGTAPLDVLADTVLDRCAELSIDASPTVAIADWQGFVEHNDLENSRIAERYLAHGFSTIICHQREFSYAHGRLWCAGRPVDVVHRLFLLEDIPEDPASVVPVLEAAVNGSIVLVSSFADEWAAYKHNFALFHAAADGGLLPDHLADLVARSVPRTWRLMDDTGPADSEPADHLVIKPVMGSSGHGVTLGAATGGEDFQRALATARASAAAHVIQRLIPPSPVSFPWLAPDGLTFADSQLNPGVFVVEGHTAGLWTRVQRGRLPQIIGAEYGSHRGGVWCAESAG